VFPLLLLNWVDFIVSPRCFFKEHLVVVIPYFRYPTVASTDTHLHSTLPRLSFSTTPHPLFMIEGPHRTTDLPSVASHESPALYYEHNEHLLSSTSSLWTILDPPSPHHTRMLLTTPFRPSSYLIREMFLLFPPLFRLGLLYKFPRLQ